MAEKPIEFQSKASVKQLAEAFQGVAHDFNGKLKNKLGRVRMVAGTPTRSSDPFAALDESDEPTFQVYLTTESGYQKIEENSFPPAWHLYVWDRGAHRDVRLVGVSSRLGGGMAMRQYLSRFHEALLGAGS